MPAKKPPPRNEKPQKQRFMEAAKDTGADVSGREFERAVKQVVKPAKAPKGAR